MPFRGQVRLAPSRSFDLLSASSVVGACCEVDRPGSCCPLHSGTQFGDAAVPDQLLICPFPSPAIRPEHWSRHAKGQGKLDVGDVLIARSVRGQAPHAAYLIVHRGRSPLIARILLVSPLHVQRVSGWDHLMRHSSEAGGFMRALLFRVPRLALARWKHFLRPPRPRMV